MATIYKLQAAVEKYLQENKVSKRRSKMLAKNFYEYCKAGDITNPLHLFTQICFESDYFRLKVENLNYSKNRLIEIFRFYKRNPKLAALHAGNPKKIANTVYADENRSKYGKLGNVKPGDGYKFRGRGYIQITGRFNYEYFAKKLKLSVKKFTEYLETNEEFCFVTACAYWIDKGLTKKSNVKSITRIVNGGYNGLQQRIKIYNDISRVYNKIK